MERIELIHVNKKLGGKEVLKGVDLTLEEGKLYGIIGENGRRKTMLLRLLAGLIHPDDGEVHYGGMVLVAIAFSSRCALAFRYNSNQWLLMR